MKNFIFVLIICFLEMPVLATCSLTGGACSVSSNFESKSLQQKYLPNNLENMQKTDAFKSNYFKPYHNELINTESSNSTQMPENNYNSNCQFGTCLPDGAGSGGMQSNY